MEAEFKEKLLDLFDRLGEDFKLIIIRILREADKYVTGRLESSIDYALGSDGGRFFIELVAEEYWEYINFGRRPGTFAPIAPLKAWAVARGIPEEAAWAINWKIYEDGIDPLPFLELAIKEVEEKYLKVLQSDEFIDIYSDEWDKKLKTIFQTEPTKYKR
jgi:hypothetical protein